MVNLNVKNYTWFKISGFKFKIQGSITNGTNEFFNCNFLNLNKVNKNYSEPTVLLTTHALIDSQQVFAKGSILDAMIDRFAVVSLLLQLLTASTAAMNLLFQQIFYNLFTIFLLIVLNNHFFCFCFVCCAKSKRLLPFYRYYTFLL
jgi:hypothetical protein